MADDNRTEIQIVADSSKLKPGMAEAQNINKSAADAMRAEWQNAGAHVIGSVNNMSSQIKGAFSSIGTSISGMQGIFKTTIGVLAGGAVFNSVIDKTAAWTNEVKNLRRALGITGEEASVLNVALRHIGMTGDDYAESAKKLARTILTNEKAFGDLDLSVRNADGSYKNSYQIMQEVIGALGRLKEGTDRNVAMAEIFKRSQVDVGKLMTLNAAAMEAARQKAEALHLIVGPEGEKTMKKYKESMNDLKLIGDSLSIGIGSAVVPAMAKLGSTLLAVPSAIQQVYKDHEKLVNGLLTGAAVWGTLTLGVKAWGLATQAATALAAIKITALKNLEMAVFLLQGGYKALTAAEMLAAGGWVIAAIGGIVVAFRGFGQTVNDVVDVFIILKNSAEKAFYFIKAGLQAMVGDLSGAKASMEKGLTLDIKAGTGQDWFSKIKGYFDGSTGSMPVVSTGEAGNTFEPTSQQKGPSPYDIAKAKWQADTDVLGMTNAKKLELYKQDLANVVKTAEEALDYKKGLARLQLDTDKEAIETKLAFLDLELAKQSRNSEQGMTERVKIAKEETAMVAKVYGDSSKEYAVAKTKEVQLERQAAEQKVKIQKEIIDHKAELAQIDYDIETESIKMKHELGKLNDAQEIAALNALENKKYQIRLKAAQDSLELMKLNGLAETQDYKKLYAQIELMTKQHNLRMTQQSNALSLAIKKPFLDLKKTIQDSLASSLAAVAKGTMSIRGLFQSMGQAVMSAVIDMWAKNTAAAIMGSQAQTAATAAAGTAATATAATTTAANMTMLESIGTALSSIPWYGWVGLAILAGVAAARGGGGSSTSTSSVNLGRSPDSYYTTPSGMAMPSYDVGAWSIRGDHIAKVHDGELIAPSKGGVADTVRGMLSGKLAPAGAGVSMNPRININASAIDGRGLGRVLANSGRDVVQGLYKAGRTLSKPNPSKWGLTK